MPIEIHGTCDPAFNAVRLAMADNFADGGEVGEAVAVWADGKPVIDLWAGHCDAARRKPWQRDTIACMFSVGKPFAIFALLMLAERGAIGLDDAVTDYRPEYGAAGKGSTTIRHIVTHMAGLPGVLGAKPGDAYDWQVMVRAIENELPISAPGEEGCYHTFTLGPAREVTQVGAVIGRTFSYELLAGVSGAASDDVDAALITLEEAGLVARRGAVPHATYIFKHALVQDAAYESLLKSTRRSVHARVAEILATISPNIAETQLEMLAHHFGEAGSTELVIQYWRQATKRARERSANMEAISHASRG